MLEQPISEDGVNETILALLWLARPRTAQRSDPWPVERIQEAFSRFIQHAEALAGNEHPFVGDYKRGIPLLRLLVAKLNSSGMEMVSGDIILHARRVLETIGYPKGHGSWSEIWAREDGNWSK